MAESDTRTATLTAMGPLAWGTTYLVTTQLLPADRPMLSGVLRALPAGVLAIVLARQLPRGAWWWRALVLGTLNIGAFFPLLFLAAYRLPGGVAAILGAAAPLVVALLARGLLAERPSRWRLGWGVVGLVGIALTVLRAGAAFDALGVLAGLAGTVSMSLGTVLTKRWGRPVGVLAFTGWQLTAGGLVLLPVAWLVEGAPPALTGRAVLGYLWLGLAGTLLAYTLWFRGLGRLPAGQAAFLPLLSPVVATALGWVVLGQSLNAVQVLGFGLALTSIVAAQLGPRRVAVAVGRAAVRREAVGVREAVGTREAVGMCEAVGDGGTVVGRAAVAHREAVGVREAVAGGGPVVGQGTVAGGGAVRGSEGVVGGGWFWPAFTGRASSPADAG